MVVIVWELDLQLPVQSVHIITKVVSPKPSHSEVDMYWTQLVIHY